jgi:hypothetical protein
MKKFKTRDSEIRPSFFERKDEDVRGDPHLFNEKRETERMLNPLTQVESAVKERRR